MTQRTVVIHQPNFLPRTKVMIKLMVSGCWVVYDTVQYVRREWQNRVYLRDAQLRDVLFSAPIQKADYYEKINNIMLQDTNRLNEQLTNFIKFNYAKAPFSDWIVSYMQNISKETQKVRDLATYNVLCTDIALKMLGVDVERVLASDFSLYANERNYKLIELCKKTSRSYYICGSGGRTYINEEIFRKEGINVLYYDFNEISGADDTTIIQYKNRSFLDFIAYNGPELLVKVADSIRKEQLAKQIILH